jgi:hypothetical protein
MASEFDIAMEGLRDTMHASAFASDVAYTMPGSMDSATGELLVVQIHGIFDWGPDVAAQAEGMAAKLEVLPAEFTDYRPPRVGDVVTTSDYVYRAARIDPPGQYGELTIWFVVLRAVA